MTTGTEEVLTSAGIDWDDVLSEEVSTSDPGPMTGSRGTGTGRGVGRPRGSGRRPAKRLSILQERLSKEMFQAGAMIGFGVPVTGYYICQESDAFTTAVVELASHKVQWIEALEQIANIQPGLVVGRTVVGIGGAIAVDRGRLNPEESAFAKFLGVTAAWEKVNSKRSRVEEGNAYVPPPATFRPV